eukprot:5724300-Amphidinium_carterae.2
MSIARLLVPMESAILGRGAGPSAIRAVHSSGIQVIHEITQSFNLPCTSGCQALFAPEVLMNLLESLRALIWWLQGTGPVVL